MSGQRDGAKSSDAATGCAAVPAARDAALTPFTLLLGAHVGGSDGDPVGTIADVMMAAAEGRIVYVALSVGGIAGFGERLFAVPWSAFVVDPVGGALSVTFARAALDDLAGFDKDSWPAAPDARLVAG